MGAGPQGSRPIEVHALVGSTTAEKDEGLGGILRQRAAASQRHLAATERLNPARGVAPSRWSLHNHSGHPEGGRRVKSMPQELAVPGSAILRCCLASISAGV